MISLRGVTKVYGTRQGARVVLDDINLDIVRGQKIGILGRNGSGKSTLIRLIGGAEQASGGTITRTMSVSWPLAFSGGFQGSLTGFDNLRFICRVYGAEIPQVRGFVEDFAELGIYLNEPVKKYSAGMRARLAFALSMAIEFDCYLIDETLSVGDSRFQDKCQHELFEKRADRAMLMVSHVPNQIRDHCSVIYVLHDARITRFDNVDQAYDYFNQCG